MAPQAAADNVPPVNIAPAPAAPAAKTERADIPRAPTIAPSCTFILSTALLNVVK